MKVRFESHWVGKMDGGGRREGKAGAATGESAKHQHLPSPCLSPPLVLPQSVCVLPRHRQCPLPWMPTFFSYSSAVEVQSYKENDPEPSLGREGQGVRYQVSPAGARETDPEENKNKRRRRLPGGCRGIWTQLETVRTWRDRRVRSPGHCAPSARAVRSFQAQACPDANQHE